MRRRKLLTGCGTVLAGLLAGCGGGDGGDGGGTATATDTPAPTATPEPTATPTEAATAAPTETTTPTPAGNVHDIGETFAVGEEDNELRYRILELFRTDRIGSSTNYATADGTYLIVVLELTNPTSSQFSFPRNDFRIQSSDGATWQRFEEEPTDKLGADERLNVGPIGYDTLSAGETRTGAVAYDVEAETEYRLWIRPAGEPETPEHFVPLGRPADAEELQGSLTG